MPRKRLEVFVDREKEIKELLAAIDTCSNTFVLGLRGYRKSALASKIVELCTSKIYLQLT